MTLAMLSGLSFIPRYLTSSLPVLLIPHASLRIAHYSPGNFRYFSLLQSTRRFAALKIKINLRACEVR